MMPELNKIYVGDCLEIMKSWPDKCVDLVVTDPPYEAEAHTKQRRVKRGTVMVVEPLQFGPMDNITRNNSSLEIARLVKTWVLIFCQIEASQVWRQQMELFGLDYKRTCIWVKPDGMPQFTGDRPGMGYEAILTMHTPGRSRWNGGGQHGVFVDNKNENGGLKNDHPTQKPVRLMTKLLRLFSNDGDVICDPFAGSGSTLVAAERLGRKWIGIEINPEYAKIAEERIAKERSQLKFQL